MPSISTGGIIGTPEKICGRACHIYWTVQNGVMAAPWLRKGHRLAICYPSLRSENPIDSIGYGCRCFIHILCNIKYFHMCLLAAPQIVNRYIEVSTDIEILYLHSFWKPSKSLQASSMK